MSLRLYCVLSVVATGACVLHAVQLRKQFYPVVVHLGTSKLSVTIMGNMVFVAALMLAQMMRQIFLGSLRAAELDRLYEKIWFAVTETCLALTIFREELRFRFVFLFTVLLFVKVFHWLSAFRVEQFYTELAVTPLTHARIMLLMGLLLVTDVFFFVWQAKTLLLEGPSFLLLFAFEYVILWSNIVTTMLKYLLYIVDMRRNGRWSNKSVYTFYLNLLSDLFQLFVYLIFFAIVLSFYGIPLHIVRDLYNAFGNFKKRIADFIRYRRVILHMNERFPAATAEELSNVDATCIICREEMVYPNARKLPCGHIFHFDCLRSWLEENTTCPTCRNPVEIDATPNRAPAAAAQAAVAVAAAPAAAAAPAPAPAPAPAAALAPAAVHREPAAATPSAASASAAPPELGGTHAHSGSCAHSTALAMGDTDAGVHRGSAQTAEEAAAAAARSAAAAAAQAHLKAMGLSMDLLSSPAIAGVGAAGAAVGTAASTTCTPAAAGAASTLSHGAPAASGVQAASRASTSAAEYAVSGNWGGGVRVGGTSITATAPAPANAAASSAQDPMQQQVDFRQQQLLQQQMSEQLQQLQHQIQLAQHHQLQWLSPPQQQPPLSAPWGQVPYGMSSPVPPGALPLSARGVASDAASVTPSAKGGALPELVQMEPVRRMLEEQIEGATNTLEELLAGSSSFDTQGQIYELQCRIEQLMLPMAQSQAGYIANMLRTAENAAARSGTGEQTPIRRLKLQQAQRVVENQQRELTDMLALCQTKTSGKPAARAY